MKFLTIAMTAACCFGLAAASAQAHSAFDGSWDLLFTTESGTCDATYSFTVDVTNGYITHPNLLKFRGYVARSGALRASVTAGDKFAAGTGRLIGNSGRGAWHGTSPTSRCAGHWTAQRD